MIERAPLPALSDARLADFEQLAKEFNWSDAERARWLAVWEQRAALEAELKEEAADIELHRLADVASANGLDEPALIDVWLRGGFALFAERKANVWSPLKDHQPDHLRAIYGLAELDRDDPEGRKLLDRGWAFVRCVDWHDPRRRMLTGVDDPADFGSDPMFALQVVKRASLLVRASGLPHDYGRWVAGGLQEVGLDVPKSGATIVKTPDEMPRRKPREDFKKTVLAMIGAMAAELAAVKPTTYANGKKADVNEAAIAAAIAIRCGDPNDVSARETTRAFQNHLSDGAKELAERRAKNGAA